MHRQHIALPKLMCRDRQDQGEWPLAHPPNGSRCAPPQEQNHPPQSPSPTPGLARTAGNAPEQDIDAVSRKAAVIQRGGLPCRQVGVSRRGSGGAYLRPAPPDGATHRKVRAGNTGLSPTVTILCPPVGTGEGSCRTPRSSAPTSATGCTTRPRAMQARRKANGSDSHGRNGQCPAAWGSARARSFLDMCPLQHVRQHATGSDTPPPQPGARPSGPHRGRETSSVAQATPWDHATSCKEKGPAAGPLLNP